MTGRRLIASAVVVGSGAPALLCAIALKRTLPRCAVTVVRDPAAAAGLADRMHWAGPALLRLHERIGIDERDLLVHLGATFRVGCAVRGWGRPAILGEGAARDPALAGVESVHTVSQALAAAERFADGADFPGGELADLDFGVRFHLPAYLQMLDYLAGQLGVERIVAPVAAVEPGTDGRVAAVSLGDGRRLAAELFVDTGADGQLAKAVGVPRIDWSGQFASDRLLIQRGLPPALSLRDDLTASAPGWTLRTPGRDGATLMTGCRRDNCPPVEGEVERIDLAPGRLAALATANLVSIGDAASVIEPLGDSPLSLAAAQVLMLADLVPGGDFHPLEVAELDRRLVRQADRARDYAACFLAGAQPTDGPYWTLARAVTQSDSLALTLDGYRRRGRLAFFEDDPHDRAAWVQLLALVAPDAPPPPPIAGLSQLAIDSARTAQEAKVARALSLAEPYGDWLAKRLPRRS